MHIRAIPTPTARTGLQRKRRIWPPPSLKEPAEAKQLTPRRWQQPRPWLGASLLCCVLAMIATFATRPAFAQTADDVTTGTLFLESPLGRIEAPRVHTAVRMNVSGIIARVEVRQEFTNPSDEWVEGLYAFPLPDNSAVNALHMLVGKRVIVGEIREKIEAQRLYEQARNNGQRASVVHQQRPNIFRTAVANIAPQETIVVTIAYLQILDQQGGRYSLRFPLTITPRYIPGVQLEAALTATSETPVLALSAQHDAHDTATLGDLHPALSHPNTQRQSVSFDIEIDAGTVIDNIASAYHAIDVDEANGAYRVRLARGLVAPDRDFELAWTPVVLGGPATALFRERTDAGEHVLLMFMPPQDRVPIAAPREVIFIIDTSGSMQGESIEQARASLLKGLETLGPADRFNVIQFNSVFEVMFEAPRAASAENLARARRYVSSLRADGGTEMLPALRAAFAMPRSVEHLRQIVFITDGAVSNEAELMHAIKEDMGDARLFVVGIGSAPNGYFMRTAAQTGRGTFTFIGAAREVEQKMAELLRKLTHPVLTNIELRWPGGIVPEYAPAQIGDLYADEPLVISARLPAKASGVLTISGRAGTTWTRQISLDDADTSPGVATLWARNRIADLMNLQTQRVSDAEIRALVLPLALEYGLVSKYTSLVAIDKTPVRRPDEALQTTRVENTKPHGSQWQASGLPQTATPAQLHMMVGALALLLALLLKSGFIRLPLPRAAGAAPAHPCARGICASCTAEG